MSFPPKEIPPARASVPHQTGGAYDKSSCTEDGWNYHTEDGIISEGGDQIDSPAPRGDVHISTYTKLNKLATCNGRMPFPLFPTYVGSTYVNEQPWPFPMAYSCCFNGCDDPALCCYACCCTACVQASFPCRVGDYHSICDCVVKLDLITASHDVNTSGRDQRASRHRRRVGN